MTVPSALEISRRATLKPPQKIAASMGIGRHLLEPYGDAVAKVKLSSFPKALSVTLGQPR